MIAAPSCHPALRKGVALQPFTSWKVGGTAEWFAEPGERDELVSLAAWAQAQGLSLRCIGAGSNLLIADSGLPGLTICNRRLQGEPARRRQRPGGSGSRITYPHPGP